MFFWALGEEEFFNFMSFWSFFFYLGIDSTCWKNTGSWSCSPFCGRSLTVCSGGTRGHSRWGEGAVELFIPSEF